jgi:hypothetical protein
MASVIKVKEQCKNSATTVTSVINFHRQHTGDGRGGERGGLRGGGGLFMILFQTKIQNRNSIGKRGAGIDISYTGTR